MGKTESTFLIFNRESKLLISHLPFINSLVLTFSVSMIQFGFLLFALLHLLCGFVIELLRPEGIP